MNWNTLDSIESFKTNELVLIFKHSPRCIVSRIVLKRFEDNFKINFEKIKFYKLDVLKERDLSNKISIFYNVFHESPQIILVKDNKCIFHESHESIHVESLNSFI
tara:strand:+ start:634 stop:948 length:315 start_codon:yes stop_codon:yes gene_type:complete